MRGLAHCPCCTPAVRAKGWRACGRGGARKPGVGGGATRAEGTVRERKGGGWRTVRAAPPPSAQRGGGRVGEVRRVNGGGQSLVRGREHPRGGTGERLEGGGNYKRRVPVGGKRAGEETGGATS